MALSKGNNQLSGNLIILRPVTRDKDKHELSEPRFDASEKVDEKWVLKDTYSQVTGNIKSVDVHTEVYEGSEKHSVKIFLSDDTANETYLLDLRMNILNRSMLNALINLKSTENVNISLYKNKKGYNSSCVRQNGEMVGWKHDYKSLPVPVEILHPKTGVKIQSDYTEVDEFFLSETTSWAKELGVFKAQGDQKPEEKSENITTPQSESEVEDW